jgi:hypothetical protein
MCVSIRKIYLAFTTLIHFSLYYGWLAPICHSFHMTHRAQARPTAVTDIYIRANIFFSLESTYNMSILIMRRRYLNTSRYYMLDTTLIPARRAGFYNMICSWMYIFRIRVVCVMHTHTHAGGLCWWFGGLRYARHFCSSSLHKYPLFFRGYVCAEPKSGLTPAFTKLLFVP